MEEFVHARVERLFAASPQRVFDGWTDPAMIARWMTAPTEGSDEILHMEADVRPGGRFSFLVLRQGQEIDHIGEYLEVERPRRLVFTWGIKGQPSEGSVVSIDIAQEGSGARLALSHAIPAAWADYRERTEMGWTRITDRIVEAVG